MITRIDMLKVWVQLSCKFKAINTNGQLIYSDKIAMSWNLFSSPTHGYQNAQVVAGKVNNHKIT